jgi:serine/threonine protein phosphatase PrpC
MVGSSPPAEDRVGSGTTLEYCDRTDVGRRRSNNQDSSIVLEPWSREQYRRRGWLFVVADGMGAHAAGEMASALAVEQVPLAYEKLAPRSPPLALLRSIEQANAEIHARGESAVDLKGMGTTCTALAILPRGAIVGHVGDSRAYRVRRGRIEQLSKDHSLAWEVEEQRGGASEPGMPSAPRNIITRSMGPHAQVHVDLEGPFPVEERDVFVLCSDGLSGQVEDAEIGLLAETLSPREAAEALVGLALVRGAPDNVTVIVARAGEKEATKRDAETQSWPLDDPQPAAAPGRTSWLRLLAVAAAGLLGMLIASSFLLSGFFKDARFDVGRDLLPLLGLGVAALVFLAAIGGAFLAVIAASGPPVKELPPNGRLGKGPYRDYDCRPTEALVEGIVSSVETAADGLAPDARNRALERVAVARGRAGDLASSVPVAAEAIAIYAASVIQARGHD